MRILGVGVATLDVINHVASCPAEDDEVRAHRQSLRRGGNVTNSLVVLGQLGHHCSWAGVLAGDEGGRMIRQDLQDHGVDFSAAVTGAGHTPTSYITLSDSNGSRTIVHYRDLPEFSAGDFDSIDLQGFDWVHFEGRNVSELGPMLQRTRAAGVGCSLEIEKPRDNIEALLSLPDLLLFSRSYAKGKGFASAAGFLEWVKGRVSGGGLAVCAWADEGAWALDPDGRMLQADALVLERVRETLGAGDVFNAGFLDGWLGNRPVRDCLVSACELAGRKCGQEGFDLV